MTDKHSWVKKKCADCSNIFIQNPFVCVTCGAQKLYDVTLEDAQKRAEAAELAIMQWYCGVEIQRMTGAAEPRKLAEYALHKLGASLSDADGGGA